MFSEAYWYFCQIYQVCDLSAITQVQRKARWLRLLVQFGKEDFKGILF